MAARSYYNWQTPDSLWRIAGRFLGFSGYTSTVALAEAIRAANPQILDWTAVPANTKIVLPLVKLG